MHDHPFVFGPGEGRSIDLGNFAMVVKAAAADTGGAFTLLEAAEPAGFGPPMHIHHDCAEAFYVLAGEYRIFVEEREFACRPVRSSTFRPGCATASASATPRAASSTCTSPRR